MNEIAHTQFEKEKTTKHERRDVDGGEKCSSSNNDGRIIFVCSSCSSSNNCVLKKQASKPASRLRFWWCVCVRAEHLRVVGRPAAYTAYHDLSSTCSRWHLGCCCHHGCCCCCRRSLCSMHNDVDGSEKKPAMSDADGRLNNTLHATLAPIQFFFSIKIYHSSVLLPAYIHALF